MPALIIVNEFSHMGGLEFIQKKYPKLEEEIKNIVLTAPIGHKSKKSDEKTKIGEIVWSGKDFNKPLKDNFKKFGWSKKRLKLEHGNVEVDFFKERIAIEVQFGKYSFVDTDFMKFEIFHYNDLIDAAVEILLSHRLMKGMYSGPADFDQVVARIKGRGKNNPTIPLWIIGVECKEQ